MEKTLTPAQKREVNRRLFDALNAVIKADQNGPGLDGVDAALAQARAAVRDGADDLGLNGALDRIAQVRDSYDVDCDGDGMRVSRGWSRNWNETLEDIDGWLADWEANREAEREDEE